MFLWPFSHTTPCSQARSKLAEQGATLTPAPFQYPVSLNSPFVIPHSKHLSVAVPSPSPPNLPPPYGDRGLRSLSCESSAPSPPTVEVLTSLLTQDTASQFAFATTAHSVRYLFPCCKSTALSCSRTTCSESGPRLRNGSVSIFAGRC